MLYSPIHFYKNDLGIKDDLSQYTQAAKSCFILLQNLFWPNMFVYDFPKYTQASV